MANSQRGLDQAHRAQMIGLRVADGVRRHVGQDEIGRAAERLAQPVRRGVVHEIHLQDGRRRRSDRSAAGRCRRSLACGRRWRTTWRPAARRDAEVDHALGALEEAEALVELDQFVGGARAIALGLGALHIGIVELALEPAGRADSCARARS